jgi:predicted HTH transcriptional regulator
VHFSSHDRPRRSLCSAHTMPRGAPSTVGRISYTPPLLSCLDDLLVRIETLLPLEMLPVTAGLRRPTVRTVPMTVAREMLANAIAHRDWRLPQPISVSITAGSIVDVVSPGGFPFGVTAANVLAHPSKPTNPALAHALQVLQVAERQGVGVDLMFRAARRYRCSRAPTFIRGPNRPDCHLHRSQ